MNLEKIQAYAPQLYELAQKHSISKIFLTGSVARGESDTISDIDFLVEMNPDASLFGVAGFLFEAEQLLGVSVDVIPIALLPDIEDQAFARNIQQDAVAI